MMCVSSSWTCVRISLLIIYILYLMLCPLPVSRCVWYCFLRYSGVTLAFLCLLRRVAVLDKVTDFLLFLGRLLISGSVGEFSQTGWDTLLDIRPRMNRAAVHIYLHSSLNLPLQRSSADLWTLLNLLHSITRGQINPSSYPYKSLSRQYWAICP